MRGNLLSRRYATALADVAQETGQIERVRDELTTLAEALAQERHFAMMINTPAHGRDGMKAVFRTLAERLGLADLTARMLAYLVDKQRANLLPELAASFVREADRRLGVCQARLTSAAKLPGTQRQRIIEALEAITRSRIHLQEQIDESLVAGFQVKLDGKFFDGSLRGRLERIREIIAHGQ